MVSHSRETGLRREVLVVKESICQCRRCKRHVGLILRSERSPGEGHGNPCLYSCLENSMDRGDWRAVVRVVTKSRTRLSTQTQQHVKETSEQLSDVQFSPHHLLKRLSFTLEYSWLLCQISIDPLCESLFLGSLFCSTGICINYCSFGKMDRCLSAQTCD